MLLIDSLYINNGGGKHLLDLLISEVNKKNIDVIYLFDRRILGEYDYLQKDRVFFLKPSLLQRHLFYLKFKKKITRVLAFGNMPPTLYLQIPVYTYFHNITFLEESISFSFKIKSFIIQYFKLNTSKWVVQSNFVKKKMSDAWRISNTEILVFPFFNENLNKIEFTPRTSDNSINFIYISDGHLYKNHNRLIDAFVEFNKKIPNSSLTLTISNNFTELKKRIAEVRQHGINIIDKGKINFDEVIDLLSNSSVVIYPSLYESFGLGLIEAASIGIPICASDLPYVSEVVMPNYSFDPFSVDSIYNALLDSHTILNYNSVLLCRNKLNDLIEIITK
jgi:glycosyltransferase involved in cell wall biosynthesis